MRKLIIILAVLLLPSFAWGSSCASNVAFGNWSSTGSWTACAGGIPQTGDTVAINNGHHISVTDTRTMAGTVTLNAGGIVTVAAGSVAATEAALTNKGTVNIAGKLTLGGGNLSCGVATSAGIVNLVGGGELALGGQNLAYAGLCTVATNSTSMSSWFKVTGTGNFGSSAQGYKINFDLSYISLQNSGIVYLEGGASGTLSNRRFIMDHVVTANDSYVVLGNGAFGEAATPVRISNCDFRHTGQMRLKSTAAVTPTADSYMRHNFFASTTEFPGTMATIANARPMTIEYNVFTGTQGSGGDFAGSTIRYNFFVLPAGAASGEGMARFAPSLPLSFESNYGYTDTPNQHMFGTSTGTVSGNGPINIFNNVFEALAMTVNSGNWLGLMVDGNVNVYNNVLINGILGSMTNQASWGSTRTYNVYNNTEVLTIASQDDVQLAMHEGNNPFLGTWNIYNNLVHKFVDSTAAPNSYQFDTKSDINQVIVTGFNAATSDATPINWYNPYVDRVAFHDGTDRSDLGAPNFVDPTRTAAKWCELYAECHDGAGATIADVRAYWARLNGDYDATNKIQTTNNIITHTPDEVVTWVRAGFISRNANLATAGYGGTFIGAFEPIAAVTAAPTGSSFSRFNFDFGF